MADENEDKEKEKGWRRLNIKRFKGRSKRKMDSSSSKNEERRN